MTERARILEADRTHVFRPFTAVETHATEDSLVVVGAEGPYLHDADGRSYFDASGAWWCNHLGFQHPRLVAALREQAATLAHTALAGATHEQAALLAEELVAACPPGMARVFFADDGSTATEIAAKLAFQYWQQNGAPKRRKFLTLAGAYHGDTVGAMSLGGVEAFHRVFHPLLFDVARAPEARTPAEFERSFSWMIDQLDADADAIAGVFIEPAVLGAAGMRMYDPRHLRALRDATHRADTFLILDEVFTGFGRAGPMWAANLAGITPDLLCTAKGLTGGLLPFGAVVATARVYDGFRGGPTRMFTHGHTFCGNPLGARVAREVLAVFRDENILDGAVVRGQLLAESFGRIGGLEGAMNARTLGMIGAVELGTSGYFGSLGWEVAEEARRAGVALRPLGDTVYVVPPLNTEAPQLVSMLETVEASIATVLRRSRSSNQ